MALSTRLITPVFHNFNFFDDMFEDMNREVARMHQDMRNAMVRLTPRDLVSRGEGVLQHQLDTLREPVVTNNDGSKELRLKFDVGNFRPDEITVKTEGNQLKVAAEHKEKTDNSEVHLQFYRQHSLPAHVDPDKLACKVTRDGILIISGPVGAQAAIKQDQAVEEAKGVNYLLTSK